MKLNIGDNVPAFQLLDTDKKFITNDSILGSKTLLLFIPAAFTSTCTVEFCSIRDNLSIYNNQAVKVIGISTDTHFALAHWKKEQHLNFTLASDYNHDAIKAFGVCYDLFANFMKGVAKRSAFIIDSNGIIRYIEVVEDAGKLPDFDKIISVLNEIN